jgi:predicted Zn finger-like uncharacterized protein
LIAERRGCENAGRNEKTDVIVACPSCGSRYRYDESRFEGKPSKKIRCTRCEATFDIANPALAAAPRLSPPVNPPPVAGNDTTNARRPTPVDYSLNPEESTREHVLQRPRSSPHAPVLRMPVGQKLSLAVIAGPDSGKTFPVDKPRIVIGRAGSDVELSDAEISRAHAAIEVSDDTVTVFDLESTNGTYVDGERVESSLLDNYGEFEIGGTTLMLIVTGGD